MIAVAQQQLNDIDRLVVDAGVTSLNDDDVLLASVDNERDDEDDEVQDTSRLDVSRAHQCADHGWLFLFVLFCLLVFRACR